MDPRTMLELILGINKYISLNKVILKFQINHSPYLPQSIESPLVHLFFVILRIGRSHRTPGVSGTIQVY